MPRGSWDKLLPEPTCLAVSDYACVLSGGRTLLHGEAREVAKNEHVRKAYLGI